MWDRGDGKGRRWSAADETLLPAALTQLSEVELRHVFRALDLDPPRAGRAFREQVPKRMYPNEIVALVSRAPVRVGMRVAELLGIDVDGWGRKPLLAAVDSWLTPMPPGADGWNAKPTISFEELEEIGARLARQVTWFEEADEFRPDAAGFWSERWEDEDEDEWWDVALRLDSGVPTQLVGRWLTVHVSPTLLLCRGVTLPDSVDPAGFDRSLTARSRPEWPLLEHLVSCDEERIVRWLGDNDWPRGRRMTTHFADWPVASLYQRESMSRHSLGKPKLLATVGSRRLPWADATLEEQSREQGRLLARVHMSGAMAEVLLVDGTLQCKFRLWY